MIALTPLRIPLLPGAAGRRDRLEARVDRAVWLAAVSAAAACAGLPLGGVLAPLTGGWLLWSLALEFASPGP